MTNLSDLSGNLSGANSFETAVLATRIASEADIVELGHVNNAVYLSWAQDIATAHWRLKAAPKTLRKFVWVALRHEIDYRDQTFAGDKVELRTWLGKVSGPRYERHVDIRKPGAARPAAKVLTVWCLIDAETRKPKRVGPEILDAFGFGGESA